MEAKKERSEEKRRPEPMSLETREKWLARIVYQRWTLLVRKRRTPYNLDFIDQSPVQASDAVLMTDTRTRMVYIFHRRDIQSALVANLCQSDQMLAEPRAPANPYTNEPLTLAQIVSVCTQLNEHAARRGQCLPVVLAAFWSARFDLDRFATDNAPLLAHAAVKSFFAEITDANRETVYETMIQLIAASNIEFHSRHQLKEWLEQTPRTPLHGEWLALVRDYTLFMNMNIPARPSWRSEDAIYEDVRDVFDRSVEFEATETAVDSRFTILMSITSLLMYQPFVVIDGSESESEVSMYFTSL